MISEFWYVTCAILIPGILLASWIDYAQRRVPNWLNLALIVIGFSVQAFFNGWNGLYVGFLGMVVGFGVLIIPWLMHGMGAGDVKLMAAIGVWIGPLLTLYSFALGAVFGAVAAIIMIVSTGRLRMACANMSIIFAKCTNRQTMFTEFGSAKSFGNTSQLLPYGVPLTGGTLVILAAKMFWLVGDLAMKLRWNRRVLRGEDCRERAATVVEFAVILPLLLTILFGIIEFGYVFMVRQSLQLAAREGCRTAVLQISTDQMVNARISEAMEPTGVAGYTVSRTTATPANPVETISISVPYSSVSLVGNFFGFADFDLVGNCSMRKEG